MSVQLHYADRGGGWFHEVGARRTGVEAMTASLLGPLALAS